MTSHNETNAVLALEQKISACMEAEQYADALETLAELVKQTGDIPPQYLYHGAYAYFMLGDYDRAASWINNTLTLSPGHLQARILLARLCILEDRTDDGLAIFDFVLEKGKGALSEDELDEIEEIVEYYGHNDEEKVKRDYPHIAKLLRLTEDDPQAQLTQRVNLAADEEKPVDEPPAEVEPTQTPSAEVPAGNEPAETVLPAADEQAQSVLRQDLPLAAKTKLLNSFASAYYLERDLKSAELLLAEALKIDASDGQSLRNMALLQAEMGNRDKAIAFASNLKTADFLLLRALREMQ